MTAAMVLAAGAAVRMGAPKQVMLFRGQPLVLRVVEQARTAGLRPVMVVTGAHAEAVQSALAGVAEIAHNPDWELGMGLSIAVGMRHLAAADAVAILLADQPLINAAHLRAMDARRAATDADMVAAQFGGTLGPPVFFKHSMFKALRSLPASAGAKYLLSDQRFRCEGFTLPEAAYDVDTPADYSSLVSRTGMSH